MEFFAPSSVPELLELKARFADDALVLAGGQSLSVLIHSRLVQPAALLSLQALDELNQIRADDVAIQVGAGVTMRRVTLDPYLAVEAPILVDVTSRVASPHVRALGTLIGNLCHAEAGSDPPQALMLLGAEVVVESVRGERVVPVRDFIVGHFQTVIEPDEVAVGVRFPRFPEPRFHYAKFRRRQMDLAVVGVAVQLVPDASSRRYRARVAVGGTGERPELIDPARAPALTLGEWQAHAREMAGEASAATNVTMADVFGSVSYRRHLVRVGIERGIMAASANRPGAGAGQ